MNKLIFLTGLLTALLFISTAHGGPYEETSELEQQILQAMMQDSTGAMETLDEEDNEMADEEDNEMADVEDNEMADEEDNEMADVEDNEMAEEQLVSSVIAAVKAAGCKAARAYCVNQAIMMDDGAKMQGWRRTFRKIGRGIRKVGRFLKRALKKVGRIIKDFTVTKKNFCAVSTKIFKKC